MTRRITALFMTLLLMLAMLVGGCTVKNEAEEKAKATKISLRTILEAYIEDEQKATAQFKGQLLQVTGEIRYMRQVADAKGNPTNEVIVLLSRSHIKGDKGKRYLVGARFNNLTRSEVNFRRGNGMTIKGYLDAPKPNSNGKWTVLEFQDPEIVDVYK